MHESMTLALCLLSQAVILAISPRRFEMQQSSVFSGAIVLWLHIDTAAHGSAPDVKT